MMLITEDDIRRTVTGNAFAAGRAYWVDRRVREMVMSANGASVSALVKGSARHPYRQHLQLLPAPGGEIEIVGQCSCPVGFNCKHVAAVLHEVLARQGPAGAPAARTFAAPAGRAPAATALPEPLGLWMTELERAAADDGEDYPPAVRQRLIYVLRLDHPSAGARLVVDPLSVTLRKDGELSETVSRHPASSARLAVPPKFLRNADRAILAGLAEDRAPGQDERFADTLERMIATGRARWGDLAGPAISRGAPQPASIVWRLQPDGSQRAELALPDGLLPVPLAEPWYVAPATGAMGPVVVDLPRRLARALLQAPPVPAGATALLRAELGRRLPALAALAPPELAPPRVVDGPPEPALRLFFGSVPFDFQAGSAPGRTYEGRTSHGWVPARLPVPMARAAFRYGPLTLPALQSGPALHAHDGELLHVRRDKAAERRLLGRLGEAGLARAGAVAAGLARDPHADDFVAADLDGGAWLDFLADELPRLRREGWAVEIAEDFPIRLAEPDGEIEGRLSEGSGIDWFELELGVVVDGQRVDLLPPLLHLLGTERALFAGDAEMEAPIWIALEDGRMLRLPLARIRPIAIALLELFDRVDGDGQPRLSRLHAAEFDVLAEAAGIAWQGGEALRALGRRLRETGSIPVAAVPADFRAVLRPYQQRGVDWLQFLREAGLGAVLADDMGLGKTVQALAHIAIEKAAGRLDRPALIVCPTSVVPNWRMEAARFTPALRLLVLHGPDRRDAFAAIAAHDVVISSYPLLTRDHATLLAQDWHIVVLDEAQMIKNPAATTSKLARGLRARQRLCLSGTPLENHLGELWSLFDVAVPGLLGDRHGFQKRFRTPIEKQGDDACRERLARRVRPFLLRRTKQEVAADLPPKIEIPEPVEMGAEQRAVYESIRLAMHERVREAIAARGLARSGIVVLDALLKMRQACCDPRLLKLPSTRRNPAGSAKFDRLMEMLPALIEEGRRVLLFSQFTEMLGLIQAALQQAGIPYELLTGNTRDRAAPVRRFQAGEARLFLVSLKAGGTGLNLTAADTVIHYDPWWNPAVEDQATDRAHRIGQDRKVFVHKLITLGTIEEKMETLKLRKRKLADGILAAERGGALAMTEADVEELFAAA